MKTATIGDNSAPSPHDAHPARDLSGKYQHFHTKSWSSMFECPCCGLRRRPA